MSGLGLQTVGGRLQTNLFS
ncbi:hypothetical protein LINGRAPRIM_LOCUS3060 [Linum grandiflorum]